MYMFGYVPNSFKIDIKEKEVADYVKKANDEGFQLIGKGESEEEGSLLLEFKKFF